VTGADPTISRRTPYWRERSSCRDRRRHRRSWRLHRHDGGRRHLDRLGLGRGLGVEGRARERGRDDVGPGAGAGVVGPRRAVGHTRVLERLELLGALDALGASLDEIRMRVHPEVGG
jgi:hypothetical protein